MNPEPKFEFDLKVAEKKQTKNENRKKNGNTALGLKLPLGPAIPHSLTPVWATVGPTQPPQ